MRVGPLCLLDVYWSSRLRESIMLFTCVIPRSRGSTTLRASVDAFELIAGSLLGHIGAAWVI